MNYEHDRKLADVYCSLREEERDMWKTEEQYKREIEQAREHIRVNEPERWEEIREQKMTAFDGGYVDDRGQEHYVEAVSYTHLDVYKRQMLALESYVKEHTNEFEDEFNEEEADIELLEDAIWASILGAKTMEERRANS